MSQNAKSLYDQACKKYFPFRGEPKYEETLALCQEICDKFPTSPESELAKIRIGQIRVTKPNLFPDYVADSSALKQTTDDKADAATKANSSYMTGGYDKFFKIFGINMSNLCDLESKYNELKKIWQLDNFISSPEMYERAIKVNADIDEAYERLNANMHTLKSTNIYILPETPYASKDDKRDNIRSGNNPLSRISSKSEDSGVVQVLYVISGFVMFVYYFIQGIHEHGGIFAACIFPWYMFKGVLWPLFVLISWY